jgi:hypothetical protein
LVVPAVAVVAVMLPLPLLVLVGLALPVKAIMAELGLYVPQTMRPVAAVVEQAP